MAVFHGNQAAVGVMDKWLSEELMMDITRENSYLALSSSLALDTALCVIYLGLERKINAEKLKRIFFIADLTRAELEHGLTTFEELEQELLSRTVELGKIKND